MQRLTSAAAVFVMLVLMLPVLACAATPSLTRWEQDCCQQMHGRCGEMGKQGCCEVEVHKDLSQRPARVVAAPVPTLLITAILDPLWGDLRTSSEFAWHTPREHSPPGLLIASTTVLRI